MSKLPEKVYLKADFNCYAEPFDNSVEYIRADISENMAKEFALHCRVSQFDTIKNLFTEWKNDVLQHTNKLANQSILV